MDNSILIIDKMHPSIEGLLVGNGFQVDYQPDCSRAQLMEQISNYQGLIVRSKTKIDAPVLEKASQLRFIGRAGSGLDNIDQQEAQRLGIQVVNAPEGNRDAVAEYTVGALLALMHNIVRSNQEVKNYHWDREGNRGFELKHKTVAIIGFGNVGQQLARRLASFDCQILVYDLKHLHIDDSFVNTRAANMEEIYEQSDIVSFHIPLSEANRYLVDAEYLAKFKKNILLINCARGEILKLEALTQALESGKVWGACLDVLENEKLHTLSPAQKSQFEYLRHNDRVILSPHIAGWTQESHRKINEVLVAKIVEIMPSLVG